MFPLTLTNFYNLYGLKLGNMLAWSMFFGQAFSVGAPAAAGGAYLPGARGFGFSSLSNGFAYQFGNNPNSTYHAFRHTDGLGLSRGSVQQGVLNNLRGNYMNVQNGKPYNGFTNVGGYNLQYTAWRLYNGTYNIGRIHSVQ
jgi:hypothetical protein